MFYRDIHEFKESAGYSIADIWYPRVTSILSIKSKPALYKYYASMPDFKTGQAISERSAQEGTAVHAAVEAALKKEAHDIPGLIRPAMEAFSEFCRNNDITPLKIEERVVSKKHRFAGTIDVLAEVNGVVGVLDIKTSQAIYRDYGMQTAAYVEALKEDKSLPSLTSWILRLDQAQLCDLCGAKMRQKGGNTKVRGGKYGCRHQWSEMQGEYEFHELADFEHNIKAFLAAKTLWEWEHAEWLKNIDTVV